MGFGSFKFCLLPLLVNFLPYVEDSILYMPVSYFTNKAPEISRLFRQLCGKFNLLLSIL